MPTYGRPPEAPPVQTNPYQQQPYGQQPPYGQPPPPPYGQPQPPLNPQPPYGHPQQPPYGQPQQPPYGHPQQPPYGQSQYPTPYGYGYGYPGTQSVKTNGLATASLVCAMVSLGIGVSAPVAVGLGIAALVQIKRRGDSGKGSAIAGIIVGAVVTVLGTLLLVIGLIVGFSDVNEGLGENSGGSTYVESLAVGECFDDAGGEDEVYRRDCAEPHDGELISNVTLQAAPYPGDRRVDDLSRDQCDAEFGKYIGNTVDKSELQSSYWIPTEDQWNSGDRLVICAAYGPDDEPLTGTVKDSKR